MALYSLNYLKIREPGIDEKMNMFKNTKIRKYMLFH